MLDQRRAKAAADLERVKHNFVPVHSSHKAPLVEESRVRCTVVLRISQCVQAEMCTAGVNARPVCMRPHELHARVLSEGVVSYTVIILAMADRGRDVAARTELYERVGIRVVRGRVGSVAREAM